jgi:hypothetical protein
VKSKEFDERPFSSFCLLLPEKKVHPLKRKNLAREVEEPKTQKTREKEKKKNQEKRHSLSHFYHTRIDNGPNFCAQRYVEGTLSCALLTSERGMRGRVVATARDFRFFFSIFFFPCFFFLLPVRFRVLSLFCALGKFGVCSCTHRVFFSIPTGDVQRRKAWKASGVSPPGFQGGY